MMVVGDEVARARRTGTLEEVRGVRMRTNGAWAEVICNQDTINDQIVSDPILASQTGWQRYTKRTESTAAMTRPDAALYTSPPRWTSCKPSTDMTSYVSPDEVVAGMRPSTQAVRAESSSLRA